MFIDVEAFLFNALVDAQTVDLLDAIEQGESAGSSPEVDNQNASNYNLFRNFAPNNQTTIIKDEEDSYSHDCHA